MVWHLILMPQIRNHSGDVPIDMSFTMRMSLGSTALELTLEGAFNCCLVSARLDMQQDGHGIREVASPCLLITGSYHQEELSSHMPDLSDLEDDIGTIETTCTHAASCVRGSPPPGQTWRKRLGWSQPVSFVLGWRSGVCSAVLVH